MKILKIFFLSFSFFLSSCSFFSSLDYFTEDESFAPASSQQKQEIIQAIRNSSSGLHSARVRAFLKLRSSLFNTSFKFSAVSLLPLNYRIELFTPGFPKLVTLIVSNEEEVGIYDAKKGKVFLSDSGESAQLIEQAIGVPLSASELFYWSIGLLDLNSINISNAVVKIDPLFVENKRFSIRVFHNNQEKIFFGHLYSSKTNSIKAKLANFQYVSGGEVFFNAQYSYDENEVLREISFELKKEDLKGQLRNINLDQNPDISRFKNKLFSLPKKN